MSSNLYSDETVQKPYIAESDDAAETSIAKHGPTPCPSPSPPLPTSGC